MKKCLFALSLLLLAPKAFAGVYSCTLSVDGESPRSSFNRVGTNYVNLPSGSGFYVCEGSLQNGVNSVVINIPSFGLNKVATASSAANEIATADYSEQSERYDEPDFHVRCACSYSSESDNGLSR